MTTTKAHDLLLVVAAALVDPDGRVLIAQRPQGKSMAGLWEFPGGKVETGETPEAALIRELREELNWFFHMTEMAQLKQASRQELTALRAEARRRGAWGRSRPDRAYLQAK